MAYSLPLMIRPNDEEVPALNQTKCKFYHLTLEDNAILKKNKTERVVRQFIQEINLLDWQNATVLAIYPDSRLLKYDQFGYDRYVEGEYKDLVLSLKDYSINLTQADDSGFYAELDCSSKNAESKNLYFNINLNRNEPGKKTSPPLGADILTLETKNKRLEFKLRKPKGFDLTQQDIILHLKFSLGSFNDIIQIIITREQTTWYGAIDFGSEASQMKFKSSINEVNTKIGDQDVDFIKILEAIYKSGAAADNSSVVVSDTGPNDIKYWQQDEDINDNLYNSIFPVKNLDVIPADFFLSNESGKLTVEYLKSIIEDFENLSYLPNLKLIKQLGLYKVDELKKLIKASFFKNNDESDSDDLIEDVYPFIMANMIGLGILSLISNKNLKKYNEKKGRDKWVLSPTINFLVRILVPNMYQSDEIYELTSKLQKKFINFKRQVKTRLLDNRASANNNYFVHITNNELSELLDRINGIEFSVIAEGDAVAIERNKGKVEKFEDVGNFAVIDCGKGTTDVSVFKKNQENGYLDTVYRGGFAGAGNALSKAIFDDFITEVEKQTDDAHKLLAKILKELRERAFDVKLSVSRLMDAIKKSYFSNNEESASLETFTKMFFDGAISTTQKSVLDKLISKRTEFITSIQGKKWEFSSESSNRKIENVLENIIDEVIYQLKIGGVKKKKTREIVIILSGRIFKSDVITQRFIDKIGEEFGLSTNFSIQHSTNHNPSFSRSTALKKRCLEGGVEEYPALNLNSDVSGIPMFVKENTGFWVKSTNKFTEPFKISPHSFKFHYGNLLPGSEMLDGKENRLLLNRFYLKLADPKPKLNIIDIYFIGRGFIGVQGNKEKNGKSRGQFLTPSNNDFLVLSESNKNAEDPQYVLEIKDRYLKLLTDSFFPFI